MRGLSQGFMDSLKNGALLPILKRVKKDDTLMIAIRDGYINIYYRGGNLIKISQMQNLYNCFFDKKYDLSKNHSVFLLLDLPETISVSLDAEKWVSSIPILKELMDFWLKVNPKLEREYQQLVERENNRSSISNETEYFIIDIEFTDPVIGARFDILAIKWPASGRRNGKNCTAAFIEMKYGDNALVGNSGLIKHIEDFEKFTSDESKFRLILEMMTNQFNQLDELGLVNYNKSATDTKVKLDNTKPEFIFLIANHNPRSKKLKELILNKRFSSHMESDRFDLRFYVNSDAGYAMHSANVITYEDYLKRIV